MLMEMAQGTATRHKDEGEFLVDGFACFQAWEDGVWGTHRDKVRWGKEGGAGAEDARGNCMNSAWFVVEKC